MKEFIKKYLEVKNKKEFILLLAEKFDLQPSSIRNHWIYGMSIPASKINEANEFAENYLKNE